jgi:hypothetical protein
MQKALNLVCLSAISLALAIGLTEIICTILFSIF